jgi:hypothetical protein
MEIQQFILDNGLFLDTNEFYYPLPESYETITNLLNTIKEYRDYAEPGSPSWDVYIQEIFHFFGFKTERIDLHFITLTEIGTSTTPKAVVGLIQPDVSITDIVPNQDWGVRIFNSLIDNHIYWGIITDGIQLKVIHLRGDNQQAYFWANLDGIIEQRRSDSFLILLKAFSYIRAWNGKKSKNSTIRQPSQKNVMASSQQNENGISLLSYYVHQFSKLHTNTNRKQWTSATKFHAPHKPFLLLSILDLYSQGYYQGGSIEITTELVDQFNKYWSIIISPNRPGNIALPFFHLRSSLFWHLIPIQGKEGLLENTRQVDTISQLQNLIIGARLDSELVLLLQRERTRTALRAIITQTYFNPDCHSHLLQLGNLH